MSASSDDDHDALPEVDDAADDESARRECVDCKTLAPSTETDYTLISSRYGWRLTRTLDDRGAPIAQWRCASCWDAYARANKLSKSKIRASDGTGEG